MTTTYFIGLLDPRLGEDGTPLEGDDEEDIFKNYHQGEEGAF